MAMNRKNAADASRSTALLIIPAYNEEENIAAVVSRLQEDYPGYDYIIINDGSHDDTARVCRENGYKFIDLPINLGLAGAFQVGIQYAYKHGYSYAIQFDADGQHLPEYLDKLVDGLQTSDIVIGSRFLEKKKPASMRMFGSNLLAGMIRLTTGQHLADPTSGMRAYNQKAIKELASGPNLGPEPDTIAYLVKKKGLKVSEVQVEMAERLAGKSYLNWQNSSAYMVRMAISVLIMQFFR